MNILGINFSHDSACALIRNGKLVAAIEEEKTSRVKQDFGWPATAIDRIFKEQKITPSDIDIIAFGSSFFSSIAKNEIRFRFSKNKSDKNREVLNRITSYLGFTDSLITENNISIFEEELRKMGYHKARLQFFNHHLSHAASAWYAAPFEADLVFTADGHGDGESITFYEPDPKNGLILLQSFGHEVSVGQFYSAITKMLGFRPTRHEGKITGLAAYGKPGPLVDKFRSLFQWEGESLTRYPFLQTEQLWKELKGDIKLDMKAKVNLEAESPIGKVYAKNAFLLMKWLEQETATHTKEDIAYACQKITEEIMLQLLDRAIQKWGGNKKIKLALAGGVFANVRVNQILFEHPAVEQIFIQPAMGDSGLALGAAILADLNAHQSYSTSQYRFRNTYIGPDYTNDLEDFIKTLDTKQYTVEAMGEQAPQKIAALLNNNVIIGFWQGAMEWGPRALGKRSMILNTFDRTVNDTLNTRLNRTEFMPFAPSVIDYMMKTYMPAFREEDIAADYMTITYDVDKKYHEQLQAVVHVDGTARPQTVKKETNPYYYDIIDAFYKLSGCGAIVNTSFNVHEEPIVSTPASAFKALEDSRIDVLVLDRYLITKN